MPLLYQRAIIAAAIIASHAGVLGAQSAALARVGAVTAQVSVLRSTTSRGAQSADVSGSAVAAGPASPGRPVTWSDARVFALFGAASALTMTADQDLQRLMQRPWVQSSSLFSHGADVFNAYGSPGVFVASLGVFGAGWATQNAATARLGLRAGEAIALSGMVTGGIKGFAGRARPYHSPDNPRDFRVFSGMRDGARQSFPSGHTTAVFAFASALSRELTVSHPEAARWARPALYTAATLTGLARMHSNNHWASDVVMGAGIGWLSGRIVARYHADRPSSWIDRRLLPRAP